MITDDDVRKVFEQCWQARRALALHGERVRILKMQLEVAEGEQKDAEHALKSAEERMQQLADRAAGVDSPPPKVETRRMDPLAGYVPVRRDRF